MLERIINWFHHVFNPHCEQCRQELDYCRSCENYKELVQTLREENKTLLDTITTIHKPTIIPAAPATVHKPISLSKFSGNFDERRRILEANARKRAQVIQELPADIKKNIDKLEEELGIEEVGEDALLDVAAKGNS